MIHADDPCPGGLFILLITLIGPAYTAMGLPAGLAVLNSAALGLFAALSAVSQWITPTYPLALRLSCYAGLTALTAAGGRPVRASRKACATATVENERLRFAGDLHDLLGHSLVTMMAKAELAERLAGVDPAASAPAAKGVHEVGRTAMLEVQQAITGYRSTSLAD
ncbi:histidine kinase [Streptomyces sp. NPDC020800]|uniref:histidine kinase n=1 Tax=Streptomyces sp. NPDC020800 TaxID=3365092 RepID=UPI0037B05FCE